MFFFIFLFSLFWSFYLTFSHCYMTVQWHSIFETFMSPNCLLRPILSHLLMMRKRCLMLLCTKCGDLSACWTLTSHMNNGNKKLLFLLFFLIRCAIIFIFHLIHDSSFMYQHVLCICSSYLHLNILISYTKIRCQWYFNRKKMLHRLFYSSACACEQKKNHRSSAQTKYCQRTKNKVEWNRKTEIPE